MLASERPARQRPGADQLRLLENFLPPLLRPLQWLTCSRRLLAHGQQMRSARLRRSALAFGMLSHTRLSDELTAAWTAPLRDRATRADVVATLKAIDRARHAGSGGAPTRTSIADALGMGAGRPDVPTALATRLAEMVPGARLEQIPESRAFVPEDQPELLAELVDGFVREPLRTGR